MPESGVPSTNSRLTTVVRVMNSVVSQKAEKYLPVDILSTSRDRVRFLHSPEEYVILRVCDVFLSFYHFALRNYAPLTLSITIH